MKSIASILIFLMTLIFSIGCQRKFSDSAEMMKWMHDASNGLTKSFESNGVRCDVKFLPAEYISWQQISDEGIPKEKLDSLVKSNKNNLVFLMTIKPGEKGKGDIMYKDLASVEEYKQRSMAMNFDMSSFIEIKVGEEQFKPVLATLENTYSASDSRSIYIVFTDETADKKLATAKEFEFVFRDELFNTGINQLVYKKEEIESFPEMAFLK